MVNSNLISFSMTPQKLKNKPTYPSAPGCADMKSAPDLPRRPVDLFWQSMKNFYKLFDKEVLSELEKNDCKFLFPTSCEC